MAAHDIIIRPLLSEKSYAGIQDKKYSFVVAKNANKTQIKLAIEEIFGVSVEKVNTAIAELKEDGTFDKIIDKYIGGEK